MVVEVTEESDEAERVGQYNYVHGVREVTVSKQIVGGVDGNCEKLELGGRCMNKVSQSQILCTLESQQNALFTARKADMAMKAAKCVRKEVNHQPKFQKLSACSNTWTLDAEFVIQLSSLCELVQQTP